MDLQHYISTTIYSVAKALQDADKALRKEGLGAVWTRDLNTTAQYLVNVHLVKGQTDEKGVSRPVLLLDYDVSVAVDSKKSSGDSADVGTGGALLQVVGITSKVEGHSAKAISDAQVQRLKFTVPVAFGEIPDEA